MKNSITILSLVKKTDEERIKNVYKKIIEKFYDDDISDVLKIGIPNQIPNQLLFALDVNKNDAVEIIKLLTFEGISIVKNDPSIGAAVKQAKFEIEYKQADTIQRIKKEDTLKHDLGKKGLYSLEELEYLRDWQIMLDVVLKQSSQDIEKRRRIKEILPEVINEAIDKEIELGARSLGAAKNSIEKLIEIAENETLKRFHFTGNIKKAGEAIIDLCKKHPKDLLGELIFLANSSSTISQINIKSFLTFYKHVVEDPEMYEYEIAIATKHLNTRALDTIHQAAVRLKPEDKIIFDSAIEYFKNKRKNS